VQGGTVEISHTLSQNGLSLQSSNFTIKNTEVILLYIVNSERADQSYIALDKKLWTRCRIVHSVHLFILPIKCT